MKQIGIDLGTSSIKIAVLEDGTLTRKWSDPHYGDVIPVLLEGLEECGITEGSAKVSVTGGNAPLLYHCLDSSLFCEEIPAILQGAKEQVPDAGCIMEIGSQNSRFLTDLSEKAPRFSASEHCAGGTGSFFEDQMSRIGMNISDYSSVVDQAESIPRISGRCSVFAKTDIIHRQQEGVPTPDILNGLCYAMIRNYKAVIIRGLPVRKPVVLCGGIAQNRGVVRAVADVFHLESDELIIPEHFLYTAALGAALQAEHSIDMKELSEILRNWKPRPTAPAEPLVLRPGTALHDPKASGVIPKEGCALGIDIGSTSTDLVLAAPDGTIIDYQYLRTAGNPERAVRHGLDTIHRKFGNISFLAVGVTGSGRARIGEIVGADAVRDEITAQAKAASFWVPDADTVFEIGGQDSKYISLREGQVVDFNMNRICAAGTGSFLEEQAARMEIPIEKMGPMSLRAKNPSDLGERCTVFMETAIASREGAGDPQEDILAGLCRSVVRNYLHRVVGIKPVGGHIVLQGGVAYNPGIVAAFQQAYGDRITVSPCFSISGAFGAAQLALESQKPGIPSKFHGFDGQNTVVEKKDDAEIRHNIELYNKQREFLRGDYDGTIDPGAKTVGIPYVLVIHRLFPMAYQFFHRLGYNVILSKPTDEDTIRAAQENARSETCYPVKLIYGHMKQLMDQHPDYIFLPQIHTMNHEGAAVKRCYGCVYMQSAPVNVARALDLEGHGIQLLSPVFDMDMGAKAMVSCMVNLGVELGHPRPQVIRALLSGANAFRAYGDNMEQLGREILSDLKPDEKVLVILTRPYGMNDPVLNMGIPELLLERGYKVITNENLPGHDVSISEDYPNMYWPFGQHILGGAKIIAEHPNLFAVYLTNHGCGPDSMLTHMVEEVMGEKPFLSIEVDEHFSKVGVITRIEAFLNSLEHWEPGKPADESDVRVLLNPKKKKNPLLAKLAKLGHKEPSEPQRQPLTKPMRIPDFGWYSDFTKKYLQAIQNIPVSIQRITPEILEAGRAETRAKEPVPFAALAGTAAQTPEEMDLLIPATTGSDTEGVYGLALRTVLRRNGSSGSRIHAPIVEYLPTEAADPDLLFRAIAAADLLYAAPPEQRSRLIPDEIPSWDQLIATAKQISTMPCRGRRIFAVGTPMCLTSLDEGIFEALEQDDTVFRAPLSEALWFLWTETPENEAASDLLQTFAAHLRALDSALGSRSPFCPDPQKLHGTADREVGSFQGGNGRYRWAKTMLLPAGTNAVLLTAPRYENSAVALEMHGLLSASPVPAYTVALDGDWDETAWSRLRSFLHYCR